MQWNPKTAQKAYAVNFKGHPAQRLCSNVSHLVPVFVQTALQK